MPRAYSFPSLVLMEGSTLSLGYSSDNPLKYCKKRESYYYETSFELIVNFSLKTIKDDESKEIFGGSNFRPILLDGTLISLL